MNSKPDQPTPPGPDSCPTTRLAASDFVAVDRCRCGTLRVHLGALTLRITPEGLHAVMQTLGEALIANAGTRRAPRPLVSAAGSGSKTSRGQS